MDKIEKFISEQLGDQEDPKLLDVDQLIQGTHASIRKRAWRRKLSYSSPIVILLLIAGLMVFPGREEDFAGSAAELYVAGWGYSWIESENLTLDDNQEDLFYNQTIDYLIDESYYTYSEDAETLLDEKDLEALQGFLEET